MENQQIYSERFICPKCESENIKNDPIWSTRCDKCGFEWELSDDGIGCYWKENAYGKKYGEWIDVPVGSLPIFKENPV